MNPQALSFSLVTLLLLFVINIEGGNSIPAAPLNGNATNTETSTSSPRMNDGVVVNQIPPITGCTTAPWICSQGEIPARYVCCYDRCVNVETDATNCGLCGVRCRNGYRCCNRFCTNTNLSPLNCGGCGKICPIGRLCILGVCAFTPVLPQPQPQPQPKPVLPPAPLPQPPLAPLPSPGLPEQKPPQP
ncbi:protein STIG1-like [Lotus japonicus]|uniref:protein STIG1-like n=1 Tax=Lotus japonicus TaxID=34305 RepID=UPI00258AC8E3|nr:protein STIG1-like [Lotus japonicus]